MTYTPRPNAANDTLLDSRDQIRTNFQIIETDFNVDHVNINLTDEGKHNQSTYIELASAPTTAANEGGVYTKVGTNPAQTNLFFRAESNGFEYQLTKAIAASTGRFANNTVAYVANNDGWWTFLGGGLILQYGRRTTPTTSGSVIYPLTFPSGNAAFSIIVTNERTSARSANIDTASSTSSGFDYFVETGGSVALNWIAIGN